MAKKKVTKAKPKKKVVKKAKKKVVKKPKKAPKGVPESGTRTSNEVPSKAEGKKIEGKEIGKVIHYFDKIGVAVIELKAGLNAGDKIRVKGATTDFEQEVKSMQVEHKELDKAKKGQAVGMKIKDRVRPNDKVYVV